MKKRFSFVFVGIVALSGCTSTGALEQTPIPTETEVPISQEQRSALSDDDVTRDEYEAGYRRFVGCLADAGFEVLDQGEAFNTLRYAVPDAAVQSGEDERCYNFEFQGVDTVWQIAHEEESESALLVTNCLAALGLDTGGNLATKYDRLLASGNDIETCPT